MNLRRLRNIVVAAAWVAAVCKVPGWIAAQDHKGTGSQSASNPQAPPPWAYPVAPPANPPAQPPTDDGSAKHVPGSSVALTATQVRDFFNVPDWHPDDHPAMPDVVVHGRKPDVRGCGYCHLPNGQGRPENASLAGLPATYIVQQMADFKNGVRKSADPRMAGAMLPIAKAASDEEVKIAADYFANINYKQWIRVVETKTVPKTKVAGGMLIPEEPAATEPIGERIIEVPENVERTELRDSASGFVAYVPVGSIKKGEVLVTTGGNKVVGGKIVEGHTIRCGICHGPDLKGLGSVPRLAGRSPSYLVRQLYNMQSGSRTGPGAELMKAVVANLSEEDLVAITAYTASRVP